MYSLIRFIVLINIYQYNMIDIIILSFNDID